MSAREKSASSRRQPEQQAPPAQRLRVRYAKRATARFTSHRDVARALERALNRARIPMAYSSGFHPHPRISYANASATGAASEAEYLELALVRVCDPRRVQEALGAQMPPGVVVREVVESDRRPFAELLTASAWRLEPAAGTDWQAVTAGVEELWGCREHVVERMTRSGLRRFDVRAALVGLGTAPRTLPEGEHGVEVRTIVHHATPLVRPDDVLTALSQRCPLVPDSTRVTRLAQGRELAGEGLATPLADPFTGAPQVIWQ